MLSLCSALACFTLPPQGAAFTGSMMGVRVHAQLVEHDPNGVEAVAFLTMKGAMLGGSGSVEGFAAISHTGDVFASPKLRAALARRLVRIDSILDEHEYDDEGVSKRVVVLVDTPFLGRIRVPLSRV